MVGWYSPILVLRDGSILLYVWLRDTRKLDEAPNTWNPLVSLFFFSPLSNPLELAYYSAVDQSPPELISLGNQFPTPCPIDLEWHQRKEASKKFAWLLVACRASRQHLPR